MFMSRLKRFFGQTPATVLNASAATVAPDGLYALTIPDGASTIVLAGNGTIGHLYTASRRGDYAGRVIFLYSRDGTVTLTATVPPAVPGDIESGNLDIILDVTHCVFLYLRHDGVWVRMTDMASN